MPEANKEQIERFLKQVMDIERKYANELKGARSNRQSEVKDLLERFSVKELDREDKQD